MSRRGAAVLALVLISSAPNMGKAIADVCNSPGLRVQVLGSGSGDSAGARAANGYLVWIDNKARVLVDPGSGSALRLAQSGARVADLDIVLLTQLHADHTLDLPALVTRAVRERRARVMPLYGPLGNRRAPSAVAFVRTLFDGTRGAYRHLGSVLSPLVENGFKLAPRDVRLRSSRLGSDNDAVVDVHSDNRLEATAVYLSRGGVRTLGWRIQAGRRSVVFTGDTNGGDKQLERLARDADVLIASHAIPENAETAERENHMPPSVLGRLAAAARTKRLVLSHRARRTLGAERESLAEIRKHYAGPVAFADDLDCFIASIESGPAVRTGGE